MKKIAITFFSVLFLLTSCKNEQRETTTADTRQEIIDPFEDDVIETAILYEANIRQYSPEGTFEAFTRDIPQLKELGVKVIWLMPVHPISETNRKATGGGFVSDIEDEAERAKYLGSYYAISDYRGINPEFGTKEDFKNLVRTAHENGMYVILDWVANHTGWDHNWLKENPDYYTKNDQGEIIDPIDPQTGESWGWTDTADLNYDNKDLWKAMIADMRYWVEEHEIDGFRADVAGEVPTEFWEEAVKEIRDVRPVFMLAESEKKDLFHSAFDMGYNWEGHHIKNELAQGKMTVKSWDDYMTKIDTTYQADDVLLNFITNHDENSWNGTIKERMGDAAETFLALTYTIPGMPLIYSGQEYDMEHRLKFFEKDSIPKTKGKVWPVMVKLGELKNSTKALHGGKDAAGYERLSTTQDEKVLAFKREKHGEELIYVANMSKTAVTFIMKINGEFENFADSQTVELKEDMEMNFQPWEYRIFIKK
ncbi:alpha-amylase family glycosyl hydrolase [soil metagenome]